MQISDTELGAALRLAIAGLIGLGFGLERQWSATAGEARFAGIRTFLIFGLLGGTAGLFIDAGHEIVAAAMILGGAMLPMGAFFLSNKRPGGELDATTEAAAVLAIALGVLAGAGSTLMAVGAGSVVVLALNEKQRLHGAVGNLPQAELRAALQFAVLALVVLPILPETVGIEGYLIHPRSLWMVVLIFSALNFAAYVAHRSAGRGRGYLLTGILGGVISSTAVTIGFAQNSRRDEQASFPLAAGVIAACTVLVPRVLIISFAINPAVAFELLPFLVPAGLVGAMVLAYAWRSGKKLVTPGDHEPPAAGWFGSARSPLRLMFAIQLAIVFQLAIVLIGWISSRYSVESLYGTAAILGLTNADALTVSMSAPSPTLLPGIAARAIAIGILANTIVKLLISVVVGSPRFKMITAGVLAIVALSIGAPLFLLMV
jgi:uncharacterized membrane protein (DUF4010 family)